MRYQGFHQGYVTATSVTTTTPVSRAVRGVPDQLSGCCVTAGRLTLNAFRRLVACDATPVEPLRRMTQKRTRCELSHTAQIHSRHVTSQPRDAPRVLVRQRRDARRVLVRQPRDARRVLTHDVFWLKHADVEARVPAVAGARDACAAEPTDSVQVRRA